MKKLLFVCLVPFLLFAQDAQLDKLRSESINYQVEITKIQSQMYQLQKELEAWNVLLYDNRRKQQERLKEIELIKQDTTKAK